MPHLVRVKLEFITEVELVSCPGCGAQIESRLAILTVDDHPQAGPAPYTYCPTCDVGEVMATGPEC